MVNTCLSPVLWKFCNHIPLTSRSDSLGCQPLCQIARLGSLLWPLELLQQCENFFGITVLQFVGCLLSGSIVELMAASSKRTDATCHASQLCCSQSPHPHSRSLLTFASTGDTQILKGWSGSVFPGVSLLLSLSPSAHKVCLCPPSFSGRADI